MKIGVLGGGQLGRMLALAGYPLGFSFRFLDPSPDAPVAPLAEHIRGSYTDRAVLERFAAGLDVVTYEFENVPVASAGLLAEWVPVSPPPAALEVAQDRLVEKTFFRELGIPTPEFFPVDSDDNLTAALLKTGTPAVLKTRRLGYDGKGQVVIGCVSEANAALASLGGQSLILESFVSFKRELSIIAVRGRHAEIAFYPLVENHHREGILRLSLAPAPALTIDLQAQAEGYARLVLEKLDYVGVLAIELFETAEGLLVNEMAPRVHNSGHWTIEGAQTSQFENHLRAVAGLSLGSTEARGHAAMLNIIGTLPDTARVLTVTGAHLHLYGKEPRPGRKLGHVTVLGESAKELAERVHRLETVLYDAG